MRIISSKKIGPATLKAVARELRRGAVIVFPTDTAYGMGCDATDAEAVRRIFKMKGRDAAKGLPIIVADRKMAKRFFEMSFPRRWESDNKRISVRYGLDPRLRGGDELMKLADRHWPGPFSIVLRTKGKIARAALQQGTAAVRVPDSALARALSRALGRPLIATSANMSGAPACYSVRAFLRQIYSVIPNAVRDLNASSPRQRFPAYRAGRLAPEKSTIRARNDVDSAAIARPDILIDAGALARRKPSTIVRQGKRGIIEVLRRGPIRL